MSADADPSAFPVCPADGLDRDDLFHVLSNSRRRRLLRLVAESPIAHGEAATILAARENDTTPVQVTKQQRKRVYIPLYQNHIPKLERLGVVEWDRDIVSPGTNYGAVMDILAATDDQLQFGDEDKASLGDILGALVGGDPP